jgi:YegS/Rv2252/BmrU family lipid kinase
VLIINPVADLGRAWRSAADLRSIVREIGEADWTGTAYPAHAVELARRAALDGYELVIAAGGDGTVHEVINGLMQVSAEQRPKLGIVPLGSGNDFSFAVGVDKNPALALRQAFNGSVKRVDVGRMLDGNGRVEYFDNTLGIGFDATVTIHSRKFTYMRGFLIYLIAVLQTVILNHDTPHMRISTDQESWEEDMLMMVVCNGSREGGGFLVAPQANPWDGSFHYTGIRRISRPMMLRLIPEVMNGTHGRFRQVRLGELRTMELESDKPFTMHADGEILAGFGVDIRHYSRNRGAVSRL